MVRGFLAIFVALVSIACEKELDLDIETASIKETYEEADELNRQELNAYIKETVLTTQESFDWSKAPINILWSALEHSDYIATVGYRKVEWKENDELAIQYMTELSHSGTESKSPSNGLANIKNSLIELVAGHSSKEGAKNSQNIVLKELTPLLSMELRIDSKEALGALLAQETLRYLEPAFDTQASSVTKNSKAIPPRLGCSRSGGEPSNCGELERNGTHYYVMDGTNKISWNYWNHGIEGAWALGATGRKIGVALLDTGVGDVWFNDWDGSQDIKDFFTNYQTVNGRRFEFDNQVEGRRDSYYNDICYDPCGHGTALAGVLGAPRRTGRYSFRDGVHPRHMTGVSYGCDLFAYRIGDDVVIGPEDSWNTASAFQEATSNPAIKIISISQGTSDIGWSNVADAIKVAYNRGKLIFAAAGTIGGIGPNVPSWAIFPSNMTYANGEVVMGVTGVKRANGDVVCDDCVKGSKVDFSIEMQLSDVKPMGLQLPISRGAILHCRDRIDSFLDTQIGGSSVATATMAGIAALVWSKNPQASREEVLQALKTTSQYSAKTSEFGHGKPNAEKAAKYLSGTFFNIYELYSGTQLEQNEFLQSQNGKYRLWMQTDGNVVIYDVALSRAIWGTYTNQGKRLIMQTDGNLVLYDAAWKPLFNTQTWGSPGNYARLEDDGYLKVYTSEGREVWSSQWNP